MEDTVRYYADVPDDWRTPKPPAPPRVVCVCGHEIWDGEAVRSRCVIPATGEALCRCKRWVGVPVDLQRDEVMKCRR